MSDTRTISQLEAVGYPWIGCECCKKQTEDASYFSSQIIASAIGKPMTKAPAIANVNSVTGFI